MTKKATYIGLGFDTDGFENIISPTSKFRLVGAIPPISLNQWEKSEKGGEREEGSQNPDGEQSSTKRLVGGDDGDLGKKTKSEVNNDENHKSMICDRGRGKEWRKR